MFPRGGDTETGVGPVQTLLQHLQSRLHDAAILRHCGQVVGSGGEVPFIGGCVGGVALIGR